MPATTTTYTLGGITFNNGATDADGVVWYATLDGWNGTPMRQQVMERIGMAGQILTESFRSARHMTLKGTAKAETFAGYWAARNKVESALIFETTDGTLVVNESTPKQTTVRTEGEPLVERVEDTYLVDFSVGYVAVDPNKYAATATSTPLT